MDLIERRISLLLGARLRVKDKIKVAIKNKEKFWLDIKKPKIGIVLK